MYMPAIPWFARDLRLPVPRASLSSPPPRCRRQAWHREQSGLLNDVNSWFSSLRLVLETDSHAHLARGTIEVGDGIKPDGVLVPLVVINVDRAIDAGVLLSVG